MYRLNSNTFIGSDAERTSNNFDVGSYFIDKDTGRQYVMLFTGDWLLLTTPVPDPLSVNDLNVTNNATVGGDVTSKNSFAEVFYASVNVFATTFDSPYQTYIAGLTTMAGNTDVFGDFTFDSNPVAAFGNGAGYVVRDISLHLPLTYAGNNRVNLNGHLGQVPNVATGSIVGARSGASGNGAGSFTQGFTNLIFYPVGDAAGIGNTTNEKWRSAWGDTVAVDSTKRLFGEDSYSLTAAGGAGCAVYCRKTVPTNTNYTFSAWVWADSNVTGDVYIRVVGSDWGGLGNSSYHPKDGQWHELSITVNSGSYTEIRPIIRAWDAQAGETINFTGAQFTETSYKLPFRYYGMPGVSGAAGSTSVVTVSRLNYLVKPTLRYGGTIAFWVKMPFSLDGTLTGFGYNDLVKLDFGVGENIDSIWFRFSNTGFAQLKFTANSANAGSFDATLVADTWYHIAYTWDASSYNLLVDGVSKASGAFAGFTNYPQKIHFNDTDAIKGGCEVSDFFISDTAATESEIKKMYMSKRPVVVPHANHELSVAGATGKLTINEAGLDSTLPMTLNGNPVATTDMITTGSGSQIYTQTAPATSTAWDGSATLATGNYDVDLSTFTGMPAVSVTTPSNWIIFLQVESRASTTIASVRDSTYTTVYAPLEAVTLNGMQSAMLIVPNAAGHIYLTIGIDAAAVKLTVNGYII